MEQREDLVFVYDKHHLKKVDKDTWTWKKKLTETNQIGWIRQSDEASKCRYGEGYSISFIILCPSDPFNYLLTFCWYVATIRTQKTLIPIPILYYLLNHMGNIGTLVSAVGNSCARYLIQLANRTPLIRKVQPTCQTMQSFQPWT